MKCTATFICIIIGFVYSINNIYSQITAPGADTSFATQYKDVTTGIFWPDSLQDTVYVFCSDNNATGTLVAPGTSGCTYEWKRWDPLAFLYIPIATTQTITDLQSGGYEVTVNCSGTINCYRAWVFVNQTINEVNDIDPGCCPFSLNGTVDKVSDFNIYNPPPHSFIIDSTTEITVCFTASHTCVSDLGFYLVAPGYGTACPNLTTPGNHGIVELLPAVSAWDEGVTSLPSTVFGCSNSLDIGTNCNLGSNIENFCFTSTLPAGDPNYTPCICDLAVPITGTFASCGPWSQIYGEPVPAQFGSSVNCGWSVQIYDCIAQDVGFLNNASITFSGQNCCGNAEYKYDSGEINSQINDNSCDPISASKWIVTPEQPYQYIISNTITSATWSCSSGWNTAWGSTNFFVNQSPSINPVPTSSCWFYLTTIDNLGCVKTDSSFFETNPVDATILPAGPFCVTDTIQQLQTLQPGGYWACPDNPSFLVGDGLINPHVGAGTYNVSYFFQGICCTDTGQTTIVINPVISISNLEITCVDYWAKQRICFDISGGTFFLVSVNGSSFSSDSVSGTSFCYTRLMPSWFIFEIDNGLGCGTFKDSIYQEAECCITTAGTISQTPMYYCDGDTASSVVNPGTSYLDGNDVLVYYLHEGTLPLLVNPVAWNTTGAFPDSNIVYGQQYYISPVAGNPDSITGVDLNDLCLDIGVGTPVLWYICDNVNSQEKNSSGNIKIIQNPASKSFKMEFDLAEISPVVIELHDANNSFVSKLASADFHSGKNSIEYNISAFPPGIYFVVIKTNQNTYATKISIIR